jgi:hypothetical protein
MQLKLSKDAINKAILAFEVGWSPTNGFAYYNQRLSKPTVPDPSNTSSGVTIGIGYDCGYNTAAKIKQDWQSILPLHQVIALAATAGLKKQQAVSALKNVKNIVVPVSAALQVFYNTTIYSFAKMAARIYPSLHKLHPIEQAVIVGLVFNRGADLDGERRREMRQLITAIQNDNDATMAALIRSMCRLWPNTLGLRKRREAEAALIAMADTPIPASEILIIEV